MTKADGIVPAIGGGLGGTAAFFVQRGSQGIGACASGAGDCVNKATGALTLAGLIIGAAAGAVIAYVLLLLARKLTDV